MVTNTHSRGSNLFAFIAAEMVHRVSWPSSQYRSKPSSDTHAERLALSTYIVTITIALVPRVAPTHKISEITSKKHLAVLFSKVSLAKKACFTDMGDITNCAQDMRPPFSTTVFDVKFYAQPWHTDMNTICPRDVLVHNNIT